MQNVINTVKGKALEVAEYLTPVLKVSGAGSALSVPVRVPSVDRWGETVEGGAELAAVGCCPFALGFWAGPKV